MNDTKDHFAVEWLRDHGDTLYAYALPRVGGNSATAEDLVQETLLAAIKANERYRGDSTRETWLTSILRNKILDHYRRAYRSKETAATDTLGGEGELAELIARAENFRWPPEASRALESKEFSEVFDICLAEINPQLAQAFMLVVMDGLSTQEACSLLGITPTNLSVRLCRARLELRERLQTRWFRSE